MQTISPDIQETLERVKGTQISVLCSGETDINGFMTLRAIMSRFEDAAYRNASTLGFSYANMKTQGLFWVLSKIRIQIDIMPQWDEEMVIETWPRGTNRLFALRDFLIKNSDGEIMIRASSNWLLLTSDSRRPSRPDKFDLQQYSVFPSTLGSEIEGLETFTPALTALSIPSTYADFDINGHVNNARYGELLMNSFPLSFHKEKRLSGVQLDFLSEVTNEGSFQVVRDQSSQDFKEYLSEGIFEEKSVFRARTLWVHIDQDKKKIH